VITDPFVRRAFERAERGRPSRGGRTGRRRGFHRVGRRRPNSGG
jgi:hypothetical protein